MEHGQEFSVLTELPIVSAVPDLLKRIDFRYAAMVYEWQKLRPTVQDLKRLRTASRGEKARWADNKAKAAKQVLFMSVQQPGERMRPGRTQFQKERVRMYELHQQGQSYHQIAGVMGKTDPQVKAAVRREKLKRDQEERDMDKLYETSFKPILEQITKAGGLNLSAFPAGRTHRS